MGAAQKDERMVGNTKTETEAQAQDTAKWSAAMILDHLTDSVFFGRLEPMTQATLAASASIKHYAKGELLCKRGDPSPGLHLLTDGMADVFLINSVGRERVICQVGSGLILGVGDVLRDSGYPCWVRATMPTEAIFLPGPVVREVVAKNPVALALINTMTRRLSFFWNLLESSGERLMPRLATFLLGHPEKDGLITLPMSKAQLAMRLGTTAESLSRALSRLKMGGVLGESGRSLRILDRKRLEEIVSEGDFIL